MYGFGRLTEEQIEWFMDMLRSGRTWSNGLVGHLTYAYRDGQFVSEAQDLREPEMGPWVKTYTEDGFRERLSQEMFVEWVHRPLVARIEAWHEEHGA